MAYVLSANFESYMNEAYKQAFATYDWAKHSNTYMESTLISVEHKVADTAHAVGQRATETFVNYYIKPKAAVANAYFNGMKKGKMAAVQTGTLALAVAVLTGQKSLQLTVGGATRILDGVLVAMQKGGQSLEMVQDTVEDAIQAAIKEVERIAKNPIEAAAETAHTFLDVLTAVIEKLLRINIPINPQNSVMDRIRTLSHSVAAVLFLKAQEITDPIQEKTRLLVDNLSKGFDLAEYVRNQKQWAMEKMEGMSAAALELKKKFEAEARKIGTKPEEILMAFIRNESLRLKEELETLQEKGQEMFGEVAWVENAIEYLKDLDEQLGEADDIYQIRDEMIADARYRLQEVSEWIVNLFPRREQIDQ